MKFILILLSLFLGYSLYNTYNLSGYETAAVTVSSFYILNFIDNIGKKIQIIELFGVGACLMWLVMPIFAYHYFNEGNYLAKLWLIYMYVPSDTYYKVVFWATLALLTGLHFPFKNLKTFTPQQYTEKLKLNTQSFGRISRILLIIGIVSIFLRPVVPSSLAQIFEITGNFIFVAAFYAYYSQSLNKFWLVAVVVGIILGMSILGGMFGKLVFISALAAMILLAVREQNLGMFRKLTVITVGFLLIVILQSVKHEFRKNTWSGYVGYTGYRGSKTSIFFELIGERLKNPFALFRDEGQLFALNARFNQGWIISKALNYIPNQKPFAGPGPLTAAILGGFIPRFLWPDKPESGGKANMLRYTGRKLSGVSMNVSPVGEAYGSFGATGAWVFMFFLGLFLRWSFLKIMVIAKTYPTLILWLPSIYVMTVVVETDVLTIFNAFIKSVFLVWLMYQLFYKLWRIRL